MEVGEGVTQLLFIININKILYPMAYNIRIPRSENYF